jgi:hypothetical protein
VRPSWLTDAAGGRQALRLEQGDSGDGQVARADVATVCVQALLQPAARGKTFEVYGAPGAPPHEWGALFAALQPDELPG